MTEDAKKVWKIMEEDFGWSNKPKDFHLEYFEDIIKATKKALTLNVVSRSLLSEYDIGIISDYGGGNVEWWQNYVREEVARCNDYWVSQLQDGD